MSIIAASLLYVTLTPQTALDELVAAQVAELFSALSDTSRIRIIAALAEGEMNVSALAEMAGISESAVSHHMRHLRQMRLVRGRKNGRWLPEQLPVMLNYLPEQTPLAICGRAPNWIYAAPAPIWLFDARLGWMTPPVLPVVAEGATAVTQAQSGWQTTLQKGSDYALLEMTTQPQYLDNQNPNGLPLPSPLAKDGLVLSGKIPNWLLPAAARQLAPGHN